MNTSLESLAQALILGTDGGVPDLSMGTDAPGRLLARIDDGEPERRMLKAAAVLDGVQRAGLVSRPYDAATPRAPADTLPADGRPHALRHARALLDFGAAPLVAEWLRFLEAAGKRVHHLLLPQLFELARRHKALQPLPARAVDQRGLWLARQNPDWRQLVATDDADPRHAWDHGKGQARLTAFATLRERDPATARALFQAEINAEPAPTRQALTQLLAVGLSDDDVALLSERLKDRSEKVRALAAGLLSRLPHSPFALEMKALLATLITHDDAGLHVGLPDESAPDLKRAGLEGPPPYGSKLGERAWRLCQAVSLTPLSWWGKADPKTLWRLAGETEWTEVLKRGWMTAAVAQRDETWSGFLLELSLDPTSRFAPHRPELAANLSPDQRLAFVDRHLAKMPFEDLRHWCALMDAAVWPAPLAKRILDTLLVGIQENPAQACLDQNDMTTLVMALPPALFDWFEKDFIGAVGQVPTRHVDVGYAAGLIGLRKTLFEEVNHG